MGRNLNRATCSQAIDTQAAPAHPATVEILAGLISELDATTEAGEFFDHACEAICRLTKMERAGVLLYDPATHAVRSSGSHGLDKDLIGTVEGTLEETPMAQRALREDRVVVATANLEREVPYRYSQFAGITSLCCAPVAAGGRWLGVIFADAGGTPFDLEPQERETILTVGRLAALAANVERATRQDERSGQLGERIALVRDIHEQVMQRLFGLVLVLGSGEPLTAEARAACHDELQTALGELRSALGRPLSPRGRVRDTTLGELVERCSERTPELWVRWRDGIEVPPDLEELAQSVFLESIRNCEKHADAASIEVRVDRRDDAFELEVINDGIVAAGNGAGLGLRVLSLEALQRGALLEFGPLPARRWHVRMVGPAS